ncbi:integrin alpha-V-like [Clytia hemisphaerica]|uniref:Uncharacterized protein n=1 Tax=Clytia hemisphaerica TaxID=252671 RepID=A0A7M5UK09_9CNID|eukprot:TCONS_00072033-protein
MLLKALTFQLVVVMLLNMVLAFNIDSDSNRIEFIDPLLSDGNTNLFGYALGFYKKNDDARLIIGAPMYDNKTGALLSCRVNGDDKSCFHMNATNPNSEERQDQTLKGEALGISISTTDNSIIACAPLAHGFRIKNGKCFNETSQSFIDPYTLNTTNKLAKSCYSRRNYFMGRCPVFTDETSYKYSEVPCYQNSQPHPGISNYANCLLGNGNVQSFNSNGSLYQFISTSGSGKYTGALVTTADGEKISNFMNVLDIDDMGSDKDFINNGKVFADKLEYTNRSSLLGYSSIKGNFTGKSLPGLASGAPRSQIFDGEVMVYQLEINLNGNLTISKDDDTKLVLMDRIPNPVTSKGGPTMYGASLAAIDINGDGFQDLAIGAPLFSDQFGNRIGQDEGRVFIFINNGKAQFDYEVNMTLTGEKQEAARFGSSITNIGDVNGDGTDDLAVGAPWGGKDGNGAVYIYNVRDGKIVDVPSQILHAPVPNGFFGHSITSSVIDTRVYPAIAISAPNSNRVFVYKAKTIITLKDNLWVDRVTVPTDINDANCEYKETKYECIYFQANIQDESTNAPETFDVEIQFRTDVRESGEGSRAFIFDNVTQTLTSNLVRNVTFKRGEKKLYRHKLYFSIARATNFEEAVSLTTSYKAADTKNNCGDGPCAILDQFGTQKGAIEVKYLRQCGTDQICDVNLDIISSEIRVLKGASSVVEPLYIGSFNNEVKLIANVKNWNESAYQAKMTIHFHEDFTLLSLTANTINAKREYDGLAANYTEGNTTFNGTGNLVKFLLDNPILENEVVTVEAQFIVKYLAKPKFFEYPFKLHVNSTGHDANATNNDVTVDLPMKIQTCVQISLDQADVESEKRIKAQVLVYNDTQKPISKPSTAREAGPIVSYNILVQNSGRVPIENMSLDVTLVDKVQNQNLIYISDLSIEGRPCLLNNINVGKLTGDNDIQPQLRRTNETTKDITARRKRRATHAQLTDTRPPIIDCLNGDCVTMTCENVLNVPVDGIQRLRLTMAVYLETLQKFESEEMVIQVTPRFGGEYGTVTEQANECPTTIELRQPFKKSEPILIARRVEWWVILVAIVGALIILDIFCVILYRIGFFKRQRYEDTQPLTGTPNAHIAYMEKYKHKGNGGDDGISTTSSDFD